MKRLTNVVWLMADHQPFANRSVAARNLPLQRYLAGIAGMAATFTRANAATPICTPARASMLTGLYPHAHGLTENNGHFGGAKSLPQDAWHIGLAFAEQGYNIGWFSKWHLSEDGTMRDHGFDGFSLPDYGYPYGK